MVVKYIYEVAYWEPLNPVTPLVLERKKCKSLVAARKYAIALAIKKGLTKYQRVRQVDITHIKSGDMYYLEQKDFGTKRK